MLLSEAIYPQLEEGYPDLLITPEQHVAPDLPTELLYEERTSSSAGREIHWSVADYQRRCSQPATSASHRNSRTTSLRTGSRDPGQEAPRGGHRPLLHDGTVVGRTNRLAIMHERLAVAMARHFPIAYTALPFEMRPMREMLQYHFARAADEGICWLREQMKALAQSIDRNDE
jgi:hypothetical protein